MHRPGPGQRLKIAMMMTVATAEIARDPRQPMRLLKNSTRVSQ